MKNSRKLLSVLFSLSMLVTPCSVYGMDSTEPPEGTDAAAAQSPQQATIPAAYIQAGQSAVQEQAEQTKEESHLPKAQTTHKYAEGSKGFFASRGESEAVNILNSQTKYTHFGNEHDATNLLNMLKSLDIIEDANAIRRSIGKREYKITDALMAHSQVRANWSYYQIHTNNVYDHAPLDWVDKPAGWEEWGENLDNYGSPDMNYTGHGTLILPRNSFDAWFYYEKEQYQSTPGADLSDRKYGHYKNLISSFSYSGAAYVSDTTYKGYDQGTALQNFLNYNPAPAKSYTVAQYRTLLKNYIQSLPDAPIFSNAVIADIPECTYDASAKTPQIRVTLLGKTLVEGQDYTVACSNNTNAGTALVKATGIGKYSGTLQKSFTIRPAAIAQAQIDGLPAYARDLDELRALTLNVDCDGHALVQGKDYEATWTKITDPQGIMDTFRLSLTGKGNYTGEIKREVRGMQSIENAMVQIENQVYSGEEICPPVNVYLGGLKLEENTDYQLSYADNLNAGRASLTVQGKGRYFGTIRQTFTIAPKSLSRSSVYGFPYHAPSLEALLSEHPTVVCDGKWLVEGQDFNVEWSEAPESGEADRYFLMKIQGTGNYTGILTYEIRKEKWLTDSDVETLGDVYDQTYTGSEIRQSLGIRYKGQTLTEGEDYIITYTDNVDAGTASFNISGIGEYKGSLVGIFQILPKSINEASTVEDGFVSTMEEMKQHGVLVSLDGRTLTENTDYTVEWADWTDGSCPRETYGLTIRGTGNYTGEMQRMMFGRYFMSFASYEAIPDQTYCGKPITPSVTLRNPENSIMQEGRDYTVSYTSNVDAGTATITLNGMGKYIGTQTLTFQIVPASVDQLDVTVRNPKAIRSIEDLQNSLQVIVKDARIPAVLEDGSAKVITFDANTRFALIELTGLHNYQGTRQIALVLDSENSSPDEGNVQTAVMYRLYNPNSGEHFYTASVKERDYLDGIGWNSEGEAWTAPAHSSTPVYRLYNPNAGDHHYTPDPKEYEYLKSHGWNDEGIGWYSDDAQGQKLFRLYNPNAKGAGSHHYTVAENEKNYLVSIGWNDEGTGWYGVAVNQ